MEGFYHGFVALLEEEVVGDCGLLLNPIVKNSCIIKQIRQNIIQQGPQLMQIILDRRPR